MRLAAIVRQQVADGTLKPGQPAQSINTVTLPGFGDHVEAGGDQPGHYQPDELRVGRAQRAGAGVEPASERGGGPDLGDGMVAHLG